MEHVAGVVCKLAHENNIDLVVSKRQQKRIESIELIRDQRQQGRQELAFNSRPFVLCGLPIRRPADGSLKHTRKNGRFVLDVVAHPDYGLPFGQDRLIPYGLLRLRFVRRAGPCCSVRPPRSWRSSICQKTARIIGDSSRL